MRQRLPVHVWVRDRRRLMLRRVVILAMCLGFALWWIDQQWSTKEQMQDRVTILRAVDATTLEVLTREGPARVRLAGIQSLDVQQAVAIDWLGDHVHRQQAWVVPDSVLGRDHAGLVYGYVYLENGHFVNEMMIREGMAVVDASQPTELRRWFRELTRRAIGRDADLVDAMGLELWGADELQ